MKRKLWTDAEILDLKRQVRRDSGCGGWVYFLVCNEEWVKIGFARSIPSRLVTLQTGCPYPLRLAYYEEDTPKSVSAERRYHRQFKSLRGHGEWFRYTTSLKNWLESRDMAKCPMIGVFNQSLKVV